MLAALTAPKAEAAGADGKKARTGKATTIKAVLEEARGKAEAPARAKAAARRGADPEERKRKEEETDETGES